MKLSFSMYAVLTSAVVAAATTAPTAAAIDLFKLVHLPKTPLQSEPSLETEDLDIMNSPEIDAFDEGKRRHLTSSEEQLTPPPQAAPTCPQRRLGDDRKHRHLTSSEDGPPPTEDPCATEPPAPTPPPAPTCPQRRLGDGDRKHRHLTSSEDGPSPTEDPCATEPPVPSPTRAPVAPTPFSECDYSLTKSIRLKPGKFTTCQEVSRFSIKKIRRKCRKKRIKKQCPGLCDANKCPCYNNNDLLWQGGQRTLNCNIIASYNAERLEAACNQPKTELYCRGLCDSSCPVQL